MFQTCFSCSPTDCSCFLSGSKLPAFSPRWPVWGTIMELEFRVEVIRHMRCEAYKVWMISMHFWPSESTKQSKER